MKEIEFLSNFNLQKHLNEALCFKLALNNFQRISDEFGEQTGTVEINAKFTEHGKDFCLDLEINTSVYMICQRCLDNISIPIHFNENIYFTFDKNKIDDNEIIFVDAEFIDLCEIIEDSIFLYMPSYPMHNDCQTYETESQEQTNTAFSVLKDFIKN